MENLDLTVAQTDLEIEMRKVIAEKQDEDGEKRQLSSNKRPSSELNTDNELSSNKRPRINKDEGRNVGKSGPGGPSIPSSSSGPSTSGPSIQEGGQSETSSSRNSGESSDNKEKDQLFLLNLILSIIKMFCGDEEY